MPLVGLAAASGGVPRDPLKPGQKDIVRGKGGQTYEGTIFFVTDKQIRIKLLPQGKYETLDPSECEVEFWEGVTNAEALLTEAERLDGRIGDLLVEIALSEDADRPKQIGEIEACAEQANGYLKRIWDKLGKRGSGREFLERICKRADQIPTLAKKLMGQFEGAMIHERIQVARGHRDTVKEVQRSVGQLAVNIARAAEKDLAPECRKIQERLRREAGFSEEGIIGQLADALNTLHDTLAALKEQEKPPDLAEIDPQDLPGAVDQLDKRVQCYEALVPLRILGKELVKESEESLAEAASALEHARACQDATSDVVALRKQIEQFQSDVQDGKVGTPRQFEDRVTPFDESLKQIVDSHRQGTGEGSKYAFQQADGLRKDFDDWKPRAAILIEVPNLQRDLQRVKLVKTATEAGELRETLEAWRARVQSYLKGRGAALGGARVKEFLTLNAKLPGAISDCQAMESDSAYAEVRNALSTITDHLQKYVADPAEPPRDGWLSTLEQDLGQIAKLKDKAGQALAEAGSTDKRWNPLADKLGEIEPEIKQAIPLARIEEIVAAIPGEITTREELDEGNELATQARSELPSVPDAVSDEVKRVRTRVDGELAKKEQALALGRVEIQFQEDDQALTERLDAADAALAGSDSRAARTAGVALLAASRMCDGLAQFVAQTPLLADSDRHARGLDKQQDELNELSERRRRLIVKIREDAGWIALPKPDSSEDAPQVLSTPENRRLHLRMLIAAGQLEEAEELAAGEELSGDPQAQSAIRPLRDRIRFAQAVRHEEADELDRAYALYQRLYSPDSEEPVSVAAGAALNRLDARFQRDRDASRGQQRLVVTILGATCLVAMALVLWRRRTRSGRVAAIRQYLGKANRAPRKGGGHGADAHLRHAAQLMAGLPPDDPHVKDLEQQLVQHASRREAVGAASKNRVQPEQPDVTQELRRIVRGGRPTEDAASCCLGWLRETRATASSLRMRRAVGVWLQRHLKPEAHLDDDELAWRARSAEQCEQFASKTTWPFLYQVRAHYWRRDYEAAMRVARRWESKRLRPADANEVLMILGQSYVALRRWKDALETFRKLLKRKKAPPQAREWMHFAWTQRQIERNAPIERDDLDRVIPSLLTAGASGKGPTP